MKVKMNYLRLPPFNAEHNILQVVKPLIGDCAVIMDSESYERLQVDYGLNKLNGNLHTIVGNAFNVPEDDPIVDFSVVDTLEYAIEECSEQGYPNAVLVVL